MTKSDCEKDTNKSKLSSSVIIQKIKSIKHIEVIVGMVVIAIVLLIYAGYISNDNDNNAEASSNSDSVEYDLYAIEDKLESILSMIDGAGEVNVLIYYDSTSEIVTEKVTNEKSYEDGSTISSSPLLINKSGTQSPIVLKEISPTIRGVVIVAQGADDIRVRLDLIKATETALGIENNKIYISKMK